MFSKISYLIVGHGLFNYLR